MVMVSYLMMIVLTGLLSLLYLLNWKGFKGKNSLSSYECGFDLMTSARLPFSYRFFLVSILFLVFDVEIVLMLPTPLVGFNHSVVLCFMCFMGVLLLGVMYEILQGALSWLN